MCRQQLAAGSQVYVEGRLQTRRWQDSQGRLQFRTEVVAQDIFALAGPTN
jgi:single-strand DNA-binding protein